MTAAQDAQAAYIAMQVWLDDVAREQANDGRPLESAKTRHKAAIAYRAARAERIDPEPDSVRPCSTCHGVRVCDWMLHGARVS